MRRFPTLLVLLLCIVAFGCTGIPKSLPPVEFPLTVQLTGSGGSVTSTPAGLSCSGSTCSGSFNSGATITLTASAQPGTTFSGWGGACSGTAACTVTMNAAQTVTANFAAQNIQFPLQVQLSGSGSGSVTSSPAGVDCGSTCTANFPQGSSVTLTPQAAAGSTFSGWGGACSGTAACTVTMNAAQTVTASFAAQSTQFPLQVQLSGSGSGSITSSPAGVDCGSTCTANFPQGSSVTLTPQAAAGSTFSGWGGACSGAGACSVTMNSNQTVTATFAPQGFQLQVQLSGTGAGSVNSTPGGINCGPTCTATFPAGTQVTLMSVATAGSAFSTWGGACSGPDSTCTLTMNSNQTVTAEFKAASADGLSKINHIIYMLQENRSFDHYFGRLNDYRAKLGLPQDVDDLVMYQQTHGALPSNPCREGSACGFNGEDTVTAFHLTSVCVENPSPSWNESHVDWNQKHPTSQTPLLDGFVWEAAGDAIASGFHDTAGRRAMGYYDGDDLPYYYFMASQFATSDRWFSPAITRTHPNRMYSMSATSQGHAYPIPSGGKQLTAKTIFQLLEEHGITWKVYHGGSSSYFDMFTYANSHQDHIASLDDYMTDVQNGTLPQVAFLEPGPDTDEHPGIDPDNPGPDIQVDAKFTSGLINALMTSSSWKDSVFILSFDEAGGFYDHVPPMAAKNPDGIAPQDLRDGDICTKGETNPSNCNFDRSGYRLPLIVVSPFVKPHYVSHTPMDYTAVLKLIETRFQLPSLTARDAAQPDMTEFFDFDNVPWATPPTPPTQPVKSGVCYNDRLP